MDIQNTDMCEPDVDLEPAKVDRVQKMIDSGNIETSIFGTGKFFKEQEEKKENIYSNIDDMLSRSLKPDEE